MARCIEFFAEPAIFRIDHYLGKEPVLNLMYFRFANPLVEASWSGEHLESVQITMAESFGVQDRGKMYDEVGAIRDVVQNHMLQVVACLAMDCPCGSDHDAIRDERAKLLQAVRALAPADVVRGQFRGYRQEPGVAADSNVETYAAVKFSIDLPRWAGVPFFVRAGKCLPVSATEVMIRFKRASRPVLDEVKPPPANYYRFRLSPETVLAFGTNVKKAGEEMVGEPIELVAHHQEPDEMEPYERLLGAAAKGDPTLFARRTPSSNRGESSTRCLATRHPSSSTSRELGDRARSNKRSCPSAAGITRRRRSERLAAFYCHRFSRSMDATKRRQAVSIGAFSLLLAKYAVTAARPLDSVFACVRPSSRKRNVPLCCGRPSGRLRCTRLSLPGPCSFPCPGRNHPPSSRRRSFC